MCHIHLGILPWLCQVRTVGQDGWESLPSPPGFSVPLPPEDGPGASNLSADAPAWQPGGLAQSKDGLAGLLGGELPTDRKWVNQPWFFPWDFCGGKVHLLSGMNHQVVTSPNLPD